MVDDLSGMGTISDSVKVFGENLVLNNGKVDNYIRPIFLKIWTVGWVEFLLLWIQGLSSTTFKQQTIQVERKRAHWLAGILFGIAHDACLSWSVGDMDNSGELNVIDLLLLSDMTNDMDIGICSQSISDINSDGETSLLDIQFLINIIMNS